MVTEFPNFREGDFMSYKDKVLVRKTQYWASLK